MRIKQELFNKLLHELCLITDKKEREAKAKKEALSEGCNWQGWVMYPDGKIKLYFGTEQNKQGYAIQTYDPDNRKKRPGIPQYSVGEV